MAKCNHCSAPLPSKSIICEYCGVRNDIELKWNVNTHKLPKSKRTCPDCMIFLSSIRIGKHNRFIVEKCERCFGLFFDNLELERLLEEKLEKSYWIDRHKLHSLLQHPLHKDVIIYRRCPVCNKIMQRKNFMKRSGVITDVCKEHGLWLDAGELKQITEWTALGGRANANNDNIKEKSIHARAQRHKRKRSHSRHYKPELMKESSDFSDAVDMITNMFGFGRRSF